MALLITGGLGYIGTGILDLIHRDERFEHLKNEKIIIYDNLQRWDGFSRFVHAKEKLPKIEFVLGDVSKTDGIDLERLKAAVKKSDRILHLASITDAAYSKLQPKMYEQTIKFGTQNFIRVAAEFKNSIKRIVNASSCNVYGRPIGEEYDFSETDIPFPSNPYAQHKLESEVICNTYFKKYSLPIISLRMATNFGYSEGIRFNLVLNKFLLQALQGEELIVYGNGENWRPFIDVKDAAAAFLTALYAPDEFNGQVFNAGSNELNLQIKSVLATISDISKKQTGLVPKVSFEANADPNLIGDSYKVHFEKIAKDLKFKLKYDLYGGLNELANLLMCKNG